MHYVQPKIIRTVEATRAIEGSKGGPESEAITDIPTSGPAYESNE